MYSKKFEEKRQIAEDFHLDYHEPEQFMRVLEQLLPVIYGERYTAYRRVVDEAAAAAEASARQQMIAEQEQAALVVLCASATAIDPKLVLVDKGRMAAATLADMAGRTFTPLTCNGQRASKQIAVAADGNSATLSSGGGSGTVSSADFALLTSPTGKPYDDRATGGGGARVGGGGRLRTPG